MALKSSRTVQYDFIADITDIKLKMEQLQGQVTGMASKLSASMAKTQTDMQKAFTTLNVRPFDTIKADIQEVQAAYARLASSGQASTQQLAVASSAASTRIKQLKAEMLGAGQQAGFLAMKIKTLGFVVGSLVFTFFTKETFRQFGEFDQRIRDVWTLTDETQTRMEHVGKALIDMTTRLPESATGLAKGLYDIVSAGIDLKDSLYVLENASKAAVAGLSDTQTSARIGVQILNAYGMEVDQISKVYDSLFNLVKRGVTTFPQIAQYIGTIIPVAASSGISLDELTASLAVLTKQGFNLAKAVTGMRFGILSLISPTEKTAETLRLAGIKWEGSLVPTLVRLKELGFDTAEALGKLGVPARSISQMITLVKSADQVNKTFIEFQQRVGIMEEAAAKQITSFKNQVQIAVNGIRASAIQIGKDFAPIVGTLVGFIGGLARSFSELPGPIRAATYALAGFSIALKTVAILFGAGAIPAAIASLKSGFETLALVAMGAGTTLQTSLAVAIPIVGAALVALGIQVKRFHDDWEEIWGQINFDEIIAKTQGYQDFTMESLDTVRGYSDLMIKAYAGAVEKKIQYLRASISKLEKEATSVMGRIMNVVQKAALTLVSINPLLALFPDTKEKLISFILKPQIDEAELRKQLAEAEKSWDQSMEELRKRAEGISVQIKVKEGAALTEKEIVQQRLNLKDLNDQLDEQRQKMESIQTQQLKTIQRLTGQKISIDDINSLLAEQMSASEILTELQKQKGLLNKKDNQTVEENLQINEQVAAAISLIYTKYQDLLKVDKDIALATAAFEENVKGTTIAVGEAAIAAGDLATAMGTEMEEAGNKMSKSVSSNAQKAKKALDKNLIGAIEVFKETAGNITLDIGDGKTAEVSIQHLGETLAESLKGGAIKGAADLKKIMLDTAAQTTIFTKIGEQWKPIDVSNILDAGSALAKLTTDQQQAWFEIQAQLTDYHRTLSDGTAIEQEKQRWKELAEEILGTKNEVVKSFSDINEIWGFAFKDDQLKAITEQGPIEITVEPGKAEEVFTMLSESTDAIKQKWLEVNAGFTFGIQQIKQFPQEIKNLVDFMDKFGVSGDKVQETLAAASEDTDVLSSLMDLAGDSLNKNVTGAENINTEEEIRIRNIQTILAFLKQTNDAIYQQKGLIAEVNRQVAAEQVGGIEKLARLSEAAGKSDMEMPTPGAAGVVGFSEDQLALINQIGQNFQTVATNIKDVGIATFDTYTSVQENIPLIQESVTSMLTAVDEAVQSGTGFGALRDAAAVTLESTTADTIKMTDIMTTALETDAEVTAVWSEGKISTFQYTFETITSLAQTFSNNLISLLTAAEANLLTLKDVNNQAKEISGSGGGSGGGFAQGGLVGGPGGMDNVPAWLTSGEYVIKKEAVKKLGTGFLSMLNSGVGSMLPKMLGKGGRMQFAAGGLVPQLNAGGIQIGGGKVNAKQTIMNVLDPELIQSAIVSDANENFILNVIRGNSAQIRDWVIK